MLNPFRPQSASPRLDSLRRLSLFVSLTPSELRILDSLLHERQYQSDEIIFDAGDEGQAIYIVLDGDVLICRQGDPHGGRIATLTAGTFFGELALLDNAPRMAQARADTACTVAVFFRADFLGLLDTHARIASKIYRELARHVGARMREMAIAAEAFQHL